MQQNGDCIPQQYSVERRHSLSLDEYFRSRMLFSAGNGDAVRRMEVPEVYMRVCVCLCCALSPHSFTYHVQCLFICTLIENNAMPSDEKTQHCGKMVVMCVAEPICVANRRGRQLADKFAQTVCCPDCLPDWVSRRARVAC